MMDIQAAMGIHQLARVERNWRRRQEIWSRYSQALADLPVGLPAEPAPSTRHAYHLYTILIDETKCGLERDQFLQRMTDLNIGVGVHYVSLGACLTIMP
jgi:dTDP-4-amino-4,6-dideoxygalactose transaminase